MVTKANDVENWRCRGGFEELDAQNNIDEVTHYDTDSDDDDNYL
jgi:hypothetical protein